MRRSIIQLSIVLFLMCSGYSFVKASCVYAEEIEVQELQIGNMMRWETLTEENNEYFSILKSGDGVNFEEVGKVMAAGNSKETSKYRYLDIESQTGRCFYKLKQFDFDGTSSESHTFMIDNSMSNNFFISKISKTITADFVNLNLFSRVTEKASYQVRDNVGKVLIKEHFYLNEGDNSIMVNIANLALDNYTLTLTMNEEIEEIVLQKVEKADAPNVKYVLAKEE